MIYGQLHVVVDKAAESDFDVLFFGNSLVEILGKVKSHFNLHLSESSYGSTGEDATGALESIFKLNQVQTVPEMKQWFEDFYSYYEFELFEKEISCN